MLVTVVPMMTMNYINQGDSAKGMEGERRTTTYVGENAEQLRETLGFRVERGEKDQIWMDEVRGRRSAEAELRRWIAGALFALAGALLSMLLRVPFFLLFSHLRQTLQQPSAAVLRFCFCPGRQFSSPRARQELGSRSRTGRARVRRDERIRDRKKIKIKKQDKTERDQFEAAARAPG